MLPMTAPDREFSWRSRSNRKKKNAPIHRIDALQNLINDAVLTKLAVYVSFVRLGSMFEPPHEALARHRCRVGTGVTQGFNHSSGAGFRGNDINL